MGVGYLRGHYFIEMKTNYTSAKERIKKANTQYDLSKLDESFTRVYNAGQLTPNELARLDELIIDKRIKLGDI